MSPLDISPIRVIDSLSNKAGAEITLTLNPTSFNTWSVMLASIALTRSIFSPCKAQYSSVYLVLSLLPIGGISISAGINAPASRNSYNALSLCTTCETYFVNSGKI